MTMQFQEFRQFRRFLIAAIVLAALSSVAAGCGGDSPGSAVANVGTTTTGSDSSGGSSGGGSGRGSDGKNPAKFSACMRSHGVPKFPDPDSNGGISLDAGGGIDPESPTFKAAEKACEKDLNITPPSAAEQQEMQEQALRFSRCMREHGVPKFPDPQFSGGKATLKVNRRNGIDPKSPQFKAAFKACEKLTPGMKQGSDERARPGGGQTQSSGGPAS
jgi:hypothetical protein